MALALEWHLAWPCTELGMVTPLQVLIVEDRTADAEAMLHALRRGGYDPVAERVERAQEYLARLEPAPDLILSDFSGLQFDAHRALRMLHERGLDIPFLIVSDAI